MDNGDHRRIIHFLGGYEIDKIAISAPFTIEEAMALSLPSARASFLWLNPVIDMAAPKNRSGARRTSSSIVVRCESGNGSLEVGTPIIVVEAPKMIKTAASVPCLRVNSGLVNPGDVGRYISNFITGLVESSMIRLAWMP